MSEWRCRYSAAANRHALHPDYYRTTEKTATPLNELCMRPLTRASAPARAVSEKRATRVTHARLNALRCNFLGAAQTDVASPGWLCNSGAIAIARRPTVQ